MGLMYIHKLALKNFSSKCWDTQKSKPRTGPNQLREKKIKTDLPVTAEMML